MINNKYQFLILNYKNKLFVLTKEKTILKINNKTEFINNCKKDIYYKTNIINKKININKKDLQLFNKNIKKYENILLKNKNKYIFGCIAIKSKKGFITTIRGKQNLDEFVFVKNVDHKNNIVNTINKKATLNAPLLDILFANKKIKTIVHLHKFDNNLPFYSFAFAGTKKDSFRKNNNSFNIIGHGVFYLFDKNNNLI
ncbi:MAG: hypothetical protein J6Q51_00955 [Clostridia bacterium]|nr:hypothetical protein [Clostridia bacterium]